MRESRFGGKTLSGGLLSDLIREGDDLLGITAGFHSPLRLNFLVDSFAEAYPPSANWLQLSNPLIFRSW